jgi:uncharacterized membrane protein YheB (UPF0754 family)
MQKDKKEIIESAIDPENQSLSHRRLHEYEYKNNQMLSDIMFAASGMGVVVLLSHSIRLISAASKQTISQSARQQIQKANQQAREIASKLGLSQKEVLKKKTGLKQSL